MYYNIKPLRAKCIKMLPSGLMQVLIFFLSAHLVYASTAFGQPILSTRVNLKTKNTMLKNTIQFYQQYIFNWVKFSLQRT